MRSELLVGVVFMDWMGPSQLQSTELRTPFGVPSDKIREIKIGGARCFFLARHGEGHSLLPHEVNYRANIFALKSLGVRYLVSVSAVGSLREEYAPGTMVLPSQFIDWTKGKRERSFFGDGIVGHASVADPVCSKLQSILAESCRKADIPHAVGGSYICIEGPQFSSRAESNIYRQFGASIIGMTNVPESYLAKEAGMAYATLAMVTDYDCWKEEHCTLEQILEVMQRNNVSAHKVLKDLIPNFDKNRYPTASENESAILTPMDKIPAKMHDMVKTLLA